MKPTLLFLLFVQLCFTAYSQSYVPFLDAKSHWTVEAVNCFPCNYFGYYYQTGADTVIDSTGYVIMGNHALREDTLNQQVWLHADTGDLLLYDFSLQVGDSIPVYELFNDTTVHYAHVTQVGQVTIGGINRRSLRLNSNIFWDDLVWIEGIGDTTYSPFYPFERSFFETSFDLNCYRYDGVQLVGDCGAVGIGEAGATVSASLQLFPNPASESIQVALEGLPNETGVLLSVLDVTGRELKSMPYRKNALLDVSGFPSGIYLVRASDTSGTSIDIQRLVIR